MCSSERARRSTEDPASARRFVTACRGPNDCAWFPRRLARVPREAGVRTAIVSTYPPRVCGIGTFAADVRATLARRPRHRARRPRRGRERAVEPPAAGRARDDRAGRSRRLRAYRPDARAARRRRRPAPARVRDLRRPRRRVRPLVRAGPFPAARRHPAHRALRADAAPGGRPDRAVCGGRARDRDDGDGAAAARRVGRLPRGEGARGASWSSDPSHRSRGERSSTSRSRARTPPRATASCSPPSA